MKLDSLDKLYVHYLKDLYSAEKQIIKALPKMVKTAAHPELRQAFQTHLEKSRGQVKRLERVFKEMDSSPGRQKCVGMEGLIEEGKDLMKEDSEPEVLDAGLIGAAQRVEHYEISAYGTVIAYAELLGMSEAAHLLKQTLSEEEEADRELNRIAEQSVNREAMNGNGSK